MALTTETKKKKFSEDSKVLLPIKNLPQSKEQFTASEKKEKK